MGTKIQILKNLTLRHLRFRNLLCTSNEYFNIHVRDGFEKSKWKFKMAFAIRGLTPPQWAKITHFGSSRDS